jgi:hypothetical protein
MFTATAFSSQDIVRDGLVLWLDANDKTSYPGSGTVWRDLSRGGNDGTLTNGPTFNSENGGSIVFDGIDDNVNLGDKDSFTNPAGFTISAWWNPTLYSGGNGILTKYQSATGLEFVFGTSGDELYGWVYDNIAIGYRGRRVSSLSSFAPLNVWSHFTYTYDGTGIESGNKLYINATQRDSNSFSAGEFTIIRNTPTALNIGIFNPGVGGPLKGKISNIVYYNRALSVQEILQNYNATRTRFGL